MEGGAEKEGKGEGINDGEEELNVRKNMVSELK